MQLKVQRSQRANVMGKILFCLDVRADYVPEEKRNIQRYKLGKEIVYSSQTARKHADRAIAQLDHAQSGGGAGGFARGMFSLALANLSLSISIDSLGKGHHVECKDLEELLDAEDAIRTAAKNLTRYLQIASTFDGSELVIEYENGEERIHISQGAPPLVVSAPQALAYEALAYEADVMPTASAKPRALGYNTRERDYPPLRESLKVAWLDSEAKLLDSFKVSRPEITAAHIRTVVAVASGLLLVLLLYALT